MALEDRVAHLTRCPASLEGPEGIHRVFKTLADYAHATPEKKRRKNRRNNRGEED